MSEPIAAVPAGFPSPGEVPAASGTRLYVVTEVRAEWVENTFLVESDPDDPSMEQGLDKDGLRLVALEIHAESGSEFIGEQCLEGVETLEPRSCEAEPAETVTHGDPEVTERIAAALAANVEQRTVASTAAPVTEGTTDA